jgi:Transposase DDE domain
LRDLSFQTKFTQTFAAMLDKDKETLLYQIFIDVDDFTNALDSYERKHQLPAGSARRGRKRSMVISEVMTILIFYHYSGYKCFQYYYESLILKDLHSFFPNAVSYTRFIASMGDVAKQMYLFAQFRCAMSERGGIYFADSKKLPVCDNRRISSNKVFKDVAGRGKSSTGWFYGLKAHLLVNNLGQVVQLLITPANFTDNNKAVLDNLLADIQGKCFADKGYLTTFFEHFLQKGVQIITKIRKNMKNKLMPMIDGVWLRKRAVIESINDILMSVLDIDHTRHRSPWNAIIHAITGINAYSYYPQKPSIFIKI